MCEVHVQLFSPRSPSARQQHNLTAVNFNETERMIRGELHRYLHGSVFDGIRSYYLSSSWISFHLQHKNEFHEAKIFSFLINRQVNVQRTYPPAFPS